MMTCKICNGETKKIFSKVILQKYDADYLKCSACGFVQTSEPVWFEEAYTSAITSLDIGLISRNLYLKERIPAIIDAFFTESKTMVDFGGGYGIFVRLMRDLGYDFYRQDLYCENLFANYFDITDTGQTRFDVLTAFEVFEHLADPLREIEKMFRLSDNLIFTTVLSPASTQEFENWWYVSPLTGQHLAFYNKASLEVIAKKFKKHLYTNGVNLHVLSAKKLDDAVVNRVFGPPPVPTFLSRIKKRLFGKPEAAPQRSSLLPVDYSFIEDKLTRKP